VSLSADFLEHRMIDEPVKVIETVSEYEQALAHLSALMDAAHKLDARIKLQTLVIHDFERRTQKKAVECMCGLCKLQP